MKKKRAVPIKGDPKEAIKQIQNFLESLCVADPFEPQYFKGSKQLLDIMLRTVEKDDLQLPLFPGVKRNEIEIAIDGGLNSIDLTFEEKNILHAIEAAFSDEAVRQGVSHPQEINLTRAELYHHLGIEQRTRPDGTKYYPEALGYQRKRIEKALSNLSDKPFPFIFKAKTGRDKKGEPTSTVALMNSPLIKVAKIYKDVKQRELPGILRQGPGEEKRFSHYRISFNRNAIGEVEHYFRYLPRHIGKSISDYRRSLGGKSSAAEINFIEYLYAESREIIEINYLKLAKKLKIKTIENKKKTRDILSRCYKTAEALGFILRIEEDRPALIGTKDIIHVNPEKFKYLRKRKKKGEK